MPLLCQPRPIRPRDGGQQAFWRDEHSATLFLQGGWGSGKTWIGARKLLQVHLANSIGPGGWLTGVPSAAIAPSYANAMDYMVPALRSAADELGWAWQWKASGSVAAGLFAAPALIFPDLESAAGPSVILVRTADAPERITGWEVGAAWGDEPTRWRESPDDPLRDPYLQLTGRVRHPRARRHVLLLTYTNEGDATRIFEEAHAGKPGHALFTARTADNPTVADFCRRQRELLTPQLAAQYLDGGAMNLRGMAVYAAFEPARHVDATLALRPGLPLQVALDFNIAPGMHAEVGQHDPATDQFAVVHEIHAANLTVLGVAAELVRLLQREQEAGRVYPVLELYGDASGAARNIGTGETHYTLLAQALRAAGVQYRLRVPAVNPPVVDRVNTFNAALQDALGQVHWRCHPRCRRLIEDLQRLRFDTKGQLDKSHPALSHASDAEGYRLAYLRPLRLAAPRGTGRVVVG